MDFLAAVLQILVLPFKEASENFLFLSSVRFIPAKAQQGHAHAMTTTM